MAPLLDGGMDSMLMFMIGWFATMGSISALLVASMICAGCCGGDEKGKENQANPQQAGGGGFEDQQQAGPPSGRQQSKRDEPQSASIPKKDRPRVTILKDDPEKGGQVNSIPHQVRQAPPPKHNIPLAPPGHTVPPEYLDEDRTTQVELKKNTAMSGRK